PGSVLWLSYCPSVLLALCRKGAILGTRAGFSRCSRARRRRTARRGDTHWPDRRAHPRGSERFPSAPTLREPLRSQACAISQTPHAPVRAEVCALETVFAHSPRHEDLQVRDI